MNYEDFVSFEVAKLLKEKGFDGCSRRIYKPNGRSRTLGWKATNERLDKHEYLKGSCVSPTHQMAMKWLREVHNLHIWFGHAAGKGLSWYYEIHGISDGKVKHIGGIRYGSYEVACEAALKYSLENLI